MPISHTRTLNRQAYSNKPLHRKPLPMKKYLLPLVAILSLALTACGGVKTSKITATGDDPSISLEAWCEEGATMYMQANYGAQDNPIMRIGADLPAMDWHEEISTTYGTSERFTTTSVLQVFATPDEGTCYVALVDDETGEFIREEVKRKDVEMTGYVPPIQA